MKKPDLSVVLSTYNAVEWLQKTLTGYMVQTFKDFEIVIADDGSTEETALAIKELEKRMPVPLIHVWHKDEGFQKSRILNKALLACNGEYIIMSDGDCIPRQDFVEVHNKNKEEGFFLSGGYFMLPMNISKAITEDDIVEQRCFRETWLKEKGLKSSFKNRKLSAGKIEGALLNRFTPTNASWNGHNASGWKKDILAINGFDERMQYGGQDRELGERLMNYGLKSKQIRYSAVCVHLDHPRGYKTKESINFNKNIRKETRNSRRSFTPYGINKTRAKVL
ncbi:glycosyltransferase family 2 protein [Autumnicola musiva]|uniref:Glycosyltransferase family 2 protein n=1 Tax=Autumnicola musiva TaxID=3075589 RepID=A0ABU3D377_9FLAO|nr:glycosyltransferase family 2 protein [Zunongwangia sp. F117]MDT0675985.1 glycosyltransferase family 2 protein [Zunongwangia sp. F117]